MKHKKFQFLFNTSVLTFHQHAGEAKIPYFAQYSDVCEDSPVSTS